MDLSDETNAKMTQIEADSEQEAAAVDNLVAPSMGWQCPTCGSVFDAEGICPTDEILLVPVSKWTESAKTDEETSTEEVMETAEEFYPNPPPSPPAG